MLNIYGNEQVKLFEDKKEYKAISVATFKLQLIKENNAKYNISKKIDSPRSAAEAIREVFNMDQQAEEILVMLTLDTKNVITGGFEISRGSLNSSIVHPREVFKRAILQNAASIIIGHNHPSGDPTPSNEDINITHRLKEAGKLLGIDLLDHVIVGDSFVSLKERGIL